MQKKQVQPLGIMLREKKRLQAAKQLAKEIEDVRKVCNAILASGCYSDKEMNIQIEKMKGENAPRKEINLIMKAWGWRKKKTKELMGLLETMIDG